MPQAKKVVARIEDGDHVLYYKDGAGSVHEITNDVKKIVHVETQGMADKLSQLFPGTHLRPMSRFVIISLEE